MNTASHETFPLIDARLLPVDLIQPGTYQPRQIFDATAMQQMADSVAKNGVMEPIVVRPIANGRFEIVAGERRWRGTRIAKLAAIPAMIRELTTMQVLELQAIENIQREDLHPLEEAHSYDLLMHPPENLHGKTVEEIADIVSKSVSHVKRQLALCQLIPDARTAFLAGHINVGTARLIARMPMGIQLKALPKILATRADDSKPVQHADAERIMQQAFMLRLSAAPFPIKDASLVASAGGCNVCPKRTGANPDLFTDVQDADTCTDPECHTSKVVANNDRRKAAATAEGVQVIEGKAASALLKFGPDSSQLNADYIYMDEPLEELTGSKSSLTKLLGTNLKPSALYEHPRDKTLREIVHTQKARDVLQEHDLLMHKPTKGDTSLVQGSTSTATPRASKTQQAQSDKQAKADAEQRKKAAEQTAAQIKQQVVWRTAVFRAIHDDILDRSDYGPEFLMREAIVDYAKPYLDDTSWRLLAELWGWVDGDDFNRAHPLPLRLRSCIDIMDVGQLSVLLCEVALLPELDVKAHDLEDDPAGTLLARACDDQDSELAVDWRSIHAEHTAPASKGSGKAKKVPAAAAMSTDKTAIYPTNEPTQAGEAQGAASQGDADKSASQENTSQAPSAQTRNGQSDLPHWVGQMVKVKKAKRIGKVVEVSGDGSLVVAIESWRTKNVNNTTVNRMEVEALPGQTPPQDDGSQA